MVLHGRMRDHCYSLLSRSSATEKTRRKNDVGGGRRNGALVHEAFAPRNGPRSQSRVLTPTRQALAKTIRSSVTGLLRELSRPSLQQAIRAPSRRLVCPEPSRRRLCRNRSHLAHAGNGLGAAVSRLDRAQETRICGQPDGQARRTAAESIFQSEDERSVAI